MSNKCLRNIQRKKEEPSEKSSSSEDKFDLESLDAKLREISEKCSELKSVAEVSLPGRDLTVSETKAVVSGIGTAASATLQLAAAVKLCG